jgi:adenosylmethionine-8-amino-7-oxononanoate aminotransferase
MVISTHKERGDCLAAAIIEPLVQGAGGMLMIDPQFQRAMIKVSPQAVDIMQAN